MAATMPNGNGTYQPDRVGDVERDNATLKVKVEALDEKVDLQFSMLTAQITDMKDAVVEKIDLMAEDVKALKARSDKHEEVIEKLDAIEARRQKRNARITKGVWASAGLVLAELLHQVGFKYFGG